MQMSTAYILLNVDPGNEEEVLGSVRATGKVSEAHRIYGIYDTIVKVTGTPEEIKKTIMTIRGLDHIRSTLTLTVIE